MVRVGDIGPMDPIGMMCEMDEMNEPSPIMPREESKQGSGKILKSGSQDNHQKMAMFFGSYESQKLNLFRDADGHNNPMEPSDDEIRQIRYNSVEDNGDADSSNVIYDEDFDDEISDDTE